MLAITFRDTKLKRISAGLSRADTVFINDVMYLLFVKEFVN